MRQRRRPVPWTLLVTNLSLALTVFPPTASAQDGRVRLQLGTQGTLWAGQQVILNLDLLTDGISFSEIYFNLPEVEGAFLLQTDSSTVKLTERIDGESWQVLRYPLALYPQSGGRLQIPPLQIRFKSSERFGAESVAFELETEGLTAEIAWPPGAPTGSLVVTSRDFELDYDWTAIDDPLSPGDAVTLEVRRRAADTSAMLLPPLPLFETEGLATYPDRPEISDRSDRGALTGQRSDRITWVVEQPGEYRIPGIRFQWWDPRTERLRERRVEGLSFGAIAGPVSETPGGLAAPEPDLSRLAWLGLLALLGGGLAWWLVGSVTRPSLVSALMQQLTRLRSVAATLRRRILPPPRALLERVNPGPRP